MDTITFLIPWLTTVAFVTIAILATRDAHRHHDKARSALAYSFVLLAVVSTIGRLNELYGGTMPLSFEVTVAAFAGSGYAFVRFRATILQTSRRAQVVAVTPVALAAVATAVAGFPPDTIDASTVQRVAVSALILAWAACVLLAAFACFIVARRESPLLRARLQLLGTAFLGFVAIMVVATTAWQLVTEPVLALIVNLTIVATLPLLYMAVSPPLPLRTYWLRRAGRRAVDSGASVGTWFWDASSNVIAWSSGVYRILGIAKADFDGTYEGFLRHIDTADRADADEMILSSYTTMRPFAMDYRVTGQTGTVRWVHTRGDVVVDPTARQATGMFGSIEDITDRKLAEHQLAASEAQLAEAQRIAGLGSWSWNAIADRVYVSPAMLEACGVHLADVEPSVEAALALVHPADRERAVSTMMSSYSEQVAADVEVRVTLPGEDSRWIHVRSTPLFANGTLVGLHGTGQDITDRKQAELALRASEERFRTLVESAPYSVVVVDASGTIVHVNEEACKMFDYTPDDLVGSTVDMLVPDAIRSLHTRHREQFLADPKRRPMAPDRELRAVRRDGTEVWIDVSLAPAHTDDGPVVIAGIQDVTERKKQQRALQDAYEREIEASERLRALDQMKDAFLEAVSHELRTPLTAVIGLAETLERPDLHLSRDKTRLVAQRLVANANRLERLLSDLLDLDRITRGVLEPHRRPTGMRDLVELVMSHVDLSGHRVFVNAEPVTANVCPGQVERIVENLLINASRHTPSGSQIWIHVRRTPQGVLIAVEDAGPGVPSHMQESIFEPFRRGEGSHAKAKGTGIGLALVAKFAELHGGRAWVEDRPGGGSSFRVLLPDVESNDEVEVSSRNTQPRAATA